MKKLIICLFIIFGCLLIPNTRVFADGFSQDENELYYIYPQLPNVVYHYDIHHQVQFILQQPNYFTLDVTEQNHYIGLNNGVSFNIPIMVFFDNETYIETYYEFGGTYSVELIWYDFYYPRADFWIDFDIGSYPCEIDVSIDYYNDYGVISNTSFTQYTSPQSPNPIEENAISAVYESNGIMHISKMTMIIYEATNGDPFTELSIKSFGDPIRSDSYNVFTQWVQTFDYETEFNVGSWLLESLSAFMSFELMPGFSLLTLFSLLVAIPLLLWILKMFIGG